MQSTCNTHSPRPRLTHPFAHAAQLQLQGLQVGGLGQLRRADEGRPEEPARDHGDDALGGVLE
jgi:hypothetical protein